MIPSFLPNWIDGVETPASTGQTFEKRSPHDNRLLCTVARSGSADVEAAVRIASESQPKWARETPVARGKALFALAAALENGRQTVGEIVAAETGKSLKDALGETDGAVALARFYAGEGQRLYGRTTTSGVANRMALTLRLPVGIAGLIVPANTPIANVVWKALPALICGNAVVLKSAEDAPATAWFFARLAQEAGLMPGILNVLHGFGGEAGAPLVEHEKVGVISFTGSSRTGMRIAEAAGRRLAKVSLELGGKNPFVVCSDADLDLAVHWASLSAFSNAGQRCAAASRMIVHHEVYELFRDRLVQKARSLKLGPADDDDLGPVISQQSLKRILAAVEKAKAAGARILCGGRRADAANLAGGHYLEPTVIEGAAADLEVSCEELFGPAIVLDSYTEFEEAIAKANSTDFGLTAAIHTQSFDRALAFVQSVQAGVVSVNGGTFGSEPHMPFGGVKKSGNGSREPGTEALDIYSNIVDVYLNFRR